MRFQPRSAAIANAAAIRARSNSLSFIVVK
jgi:hypothetical protein